MIVITRLEVKDMPRSSNSYEKDYPPKNSSYKRKYEKIMIDQKMFCRVKALEGEEKEVLVGWNENELDCSMTSFTLREIIGIKIDADAKRLQQILDVLHEQNGMLHMLNNLTFIGRCNFLFKNFKWLLWGKGDNKMPDKYYDENLALCIKEEIKRYGWVLVTEDDGMPIFQSIPPKLSHAIRDFLNSIDD